VKARIRPTTIQVRYFLIGESPFSPVEEPFSAALLWLSSRLFYILNALLMQLLLRTDLFKKDGTVGQTGLPEVFVVLIDKPIFICEK